MTEEPKPIDPEQIKYLLNGKNNKSQHHIKYDYYKPESFESELDEFISYSEVKNELQQYELEYNDNYLPWKQCTNKEKRNNVQQLVNSLDNLEEDKRIGASKCLAYIALGSYGEFVGHDQKALHLDNMEKSNHLLFEADILTTLKQGLNHGCHQLETSSITCQTEPVESFCKEIDIYLTILFLVVEYNKHRQLEEYKLAEFLFDLVIRLKEHFTKTFPLKKLMLNLYKILSITLGDLDDDYKQMKSNIRTICDLPLIQDKSTTIKCTPEDLYSFYHQSSERYPTFTPLDLPKKFADPLTITASTRLIQAMGLYQASKHIDLPYQTLFPSKNQQQQQQQMNNNSIANKNKQLGIEATNVLPFTEKSAIEPYRLSEASSIWMEHLYLSVANYQIIHEREKAVHRWQRKNEKNENHSDEWQEIIYKKLNEKDQRKVEQIEQLYSSIVPHFQSIVVVMLKLLLSTVSIGKDKEAEILEDINITRNRETISKAVSGILLLLLKWFKTSHVLKFEYLSQILIDSGCMLLILKLLGLQEVALLASKKTDDDSQSFFGFVQQIPNTENEEGEEEEEEEEEEELYTNKRNLFWSINLLRILQMLTKRKTHRILLLVQYKSSAILKRLLKVGHPVMDLYVLKNLKNQVLFMGRKWRSSNMKTISAIYSHCLTSLNDDWLSSPEGNGDMEDGAMKEINLRMLTRLYNGQLYLPNILPKMDEVTGPDSTLFYINGYTSSNIAMEEKGRQLPEYNLNAPVFVDDVELDLDFKKDYRNWLETNIYSTTDEEDEDEDEETNSDDNDNDNTWHIGTPLPDTLPIPITVDDLTREINKLYMEELQREFNEKQQKQFEMEKTAEVDGWDQPTVGANSWGEVNGIANSNYVNNTAVNFGDDDEADEIEPEIDPLQGINWNSLTEEDLKKRLTLVEEKTVQRWLNIDMNDPRYLKVLNTFEGEILEDDEGWPI